MDQNGIKALNELAKALSRQALTDKEYDTKQQERYFERVNYEETKATLQELRIPEELQNFIPREPAKFGRLNEQARKTRRNNFKVPKCFPAATSFRTGNRNKTLDKALKNLSQHFQSNVKYNLGGTIETATKLADTGTKLRRRIREHQHLPLLIKEQADKGVNLNLHADYICKRLQSELGLYKDILAELQETFDRLQDLIFLQSDAAADGIEQIKTICLALKNLKPRKQNVYPTKDDYKDAQGNRYGRPFYPRGGRGNPNRGGRRGGRRNEYYPNRRQDNGYGYGNGGYGGGYGGYDNGRQNRYGPRDNGQQRQ